MSEHAFAELGLRADATDEEVKAAWRRLVSLWHPDRNGSAQAVAKVQRINQAFEAIRQARQQGRMPPAAAPDEPTASHEARTRTHPESDESDERAPDRPIRRKLKLSLEEAAAGCIKLVRGRRTPACAACDGAGHRMLGGGCRTCRGSGTVQRPSVWFGWPGAAAPCGDCGGSGLARQACAACQGSGKGAALAYQVQVRIPHGVRDGDLLHAAARRARHRPAPADLEIQVAVAPHAFFRLEADGEVRCEVPVDGFAWIAQRTVQVPTLYGPQPLALARDRLRHTLAGQGFPRTRGGERGDQVVEIVPVFPEPFSTDQQILLDQLIATMGGAGTPARLREWQGVLRRWEKARRGG